MHTVNFWLSLFFITAFAFWIPVSSFKEIWYLKGWRKVKSAKVFLAFILEIVLPILTVAGLMLLVQDYLDGNLVEHGLNDWSPLDTTLLLIMLAQFFIKVLLMIFSKEFYTTFKAEGR